MSFLDKHGLETLVGEINERTIVKKLVTITDDNKKQLKITVESIDAAKPMLMRADVQAATGTMVAPFTSICILSDDVGNTATLLNDNPIGWFDGEDEFKGSAKYIVTDNNTQNQKQFDVYVDALDLAECFIVQLRGVNIKTDAVLIELVSGKDTPIDALQIQKSELSVLQNNVNSGGGSGGGGSLDYAKRAGVADRLSSPSKAIDSVFRNVWFNDSTISGLLVVDSDFQYNPGTNTLKVGTIDATSVKPDKLYLPAPSTPKGNTIASTGKGYYIICAFYTDSRGGEQLLNSGLLYWDGETSSIIDVYDDYDILLNYTGDIHVRENGLPITDNCKILVTHLPINV